MKLITLNTWGGRVHEPLLEFFQKYQDVDIFCLQEIYHNAPDHAIKEFGGTHDLYIDIAKVLIDHRGYFRPCLESHYGLSIFVKKEIQILEEGDLKIYEPVNYQGGGNHSRNLSYIIFEKGGVKYIIINVHGLWNGKGKGDFPERMVQSKIIKDFSNKYSGLKIICGDFNLKPDTQSLAIIAEDMKDCVADFNIQSTRTSLYPRSEKFADYVFTSRDLAIKDFQVLPEEVSDHAALLLEF